MFQSCSVYTPTCSTCSEVGVGKRRLCVSGSDMAGEELPGMDDSSISLSTLACIWHTAAVTGAHGACLAFERPESPCLAYCKLQGCSRTKHL